MTNKILCATDGTNDSDKALTFAFDLAKELKAQLTIVAVNAVYYAMRAHRACLQADSEIKKILDDTSANAQRAGLANVSTDATTGRDVAATIVSYAEMHEFDHIVVGSGGFTGLARLMIGPVASEVVAKAHCPVTIVR